MLKTFLYSLQLYKYFQPPNDMEIKTEKKSEKQVPTKELKLRTRKRRGQNKEKYNASHGLLSQKWIYGRY